MSMLLARSDLPDGWEALASAGEGASPENDIYGTPADRSVTPVSQAAAQFENIRLGTALTQVVQVYEAGDGLRAMK